MGRQTESVIIARRWRRILEGIHFLLNVNKKGSLLLLVNGVGKLNPCDPPRRIWAQPMGVTCTRRLPPFTFLFCSSEGERKNILRVKGDSRVNIIRILEEGRPFKGLDIRMLVFQKAYSRVKWRGAFCYKTLSGISALHILYSRFLDGSKSCTERERDSH